MIYFQLLLVYLKIGLLGFGGGYAMLTLIQEEVVEKHGWLSIQEFTDIVAVSQMTPGPIGVNSATYIGYVVTGSVWGSILATVAVMIPSFVLVFIISLSFAKFRNNPHVEAVFTGIRPAAVGLIAAAAMLLMNKENFVDTGSYIFFGLTLVAVLRNWIHPMLLIVLAGVGGFVVYSGLIF